MLDIEELKKQVVQVQEKVHDARLNLDEMKDLVKQAEARIAAVEGAQRC